MNSECGNSYNNNGPDVAVSTIEIQIEGLSKTEEVLTTARDITC
jgi:hypothetical protein